MQNLTLMQRADAIDRAIARLEAQTSGDPFWRENALRLLRAMRDRIRHEAEGGEKPCDSFGP